MTLTGLYFFLAWLLGGITTAIIVNLRTHEDINPQWGADSTNLNRASTAYPQRPRSW